MMGGVVLSPTTKIDHSRTSSAIWSGWPPGIVLRRFYSGSTQEHPDGPESELPAKCVLLSL